MYITVRQKSYQHQISWEDLLMGVDVKSPWNAPGSAGTITRIVYSIPEEIVRKADIPRLIARLQKFTNDHKNLYEANRQDLYRTFFIPKRNGGLRRIDAPNDALMAALRQLKDILEIDCGALYHTSAFAYVKNRCHIDAIRKHQQNESNWFLKLDFKNFFGSTNKTFLFNMISKSFPFCEIIKSPEGKTALVNALDLCFLNGGLPQGTPISPTLTNIMMIPIDHLIFNTLAKKRFVYTRYADDLLISCIQAFDHREMTNYVNQVLNQMNAPFRINDEKTRYGSRKGSNWNLGIMLNKDNNITVGHMKKKHFKAALCNFIRDFQSENFWPIDEVRTLSGTMSYYKSIESEYFDYVVEHMNHKFNCNIQEMIRFQLTGNAMN